jgi:hypothetical protein
MRDRVFQPLEMTRSSMTWESRFKDDLALPYCCKRWKLMLR